MRMTIGGCTQRSDLLAHPKKYMWSADTRAWASVRCALWLAGGGGLRSRRRTDDL